MKKRLYDDTGFCQANEIWDDSRASESHITELQVFLIHRDPKILMEFFVFSPVFGPSLEKIIPV